MRKKYYLLLTFLLTLIVQVGFAQTKTITGVVKEAGTGDPLPGVNVTVKGTDIGASTDFDGKYSIKAEPGQTLVFSFLGYKTVSKKVGDNSVINVVLQEEKEMLKAVTINALGVEVKKASQKAIAISNVKAKTLVSSGESDPVAALSGKVSGVNINLASGDPGASTNITIRGPKSILLSNKPLFVVDGIPIVDDIYGSGVAGVERPSKIADIDPNNIESIKILKGGSAAAIWGSKGANGVILITTKKGKKAKKGQFNVTISSSFSFDNSLTKFPLQDKYGQGKNGKQVYPGNWFKESGSWGDKIADRSGAADGTDPNYYFLDQDGKKWELVYQKNSKETYNKKNYDAVIGTGNTLRNSVQVSTATEKARYFLGFNHLDQTGIFAQSYYKKIGLNYNSIMNPNKKLTIKTNVQYSNTKQNAIQKGSNLSGLLLGLYRTPADFDNSGYFGERHDNGVVTKYSHRSYRQPVGTPYKGRGYLAQSAGYNNPLFTVYKQKNPYYTNHIITGTNFSHQTLGWLRLTAKAGVDYANEKADEYMPVNSADAVTGSYSTYIYSYLQISGDLIAQINTQVSDDITADILLGFNVFHNESDYNSAYYYDFILPTDVPNPSNAVNEKKYPGFGSSVKRKNSGYGTATFSYKDLLYTTFTGRVERSSAYYGLIAYPSVSLAFDVHNLEYFKKQDSDLLNQITLRGSWSKVGNEPGSYLLDTYYIAASDGDGYGSFWMASNYGGAFWRSYLKGNADIQPEITTEFEVGADVKMFDHRLSLNVSYYDSKSTDLILYEKIPAATGYLYRWGNVAEMTNKGLEVEASYKIINKKDLGLTLGGTFSNNKNTVTKLKGSDYIGLDGFISTSSGVAEGYGYGILRSGDFKRDDSGNLVLDDNGFPQAGEKIYAGDPNPDFKASVYTNFNYKNFSLRVLADGSFGGQSWYGTYGALTYFGRTLETANEVTVDGSIVNSRGETVQSLVFSNQISGVDNGDGTYTVRGNVQDFGAGDVLLDETWYTGLGGGFGPVGTQFFRDATWIKLREVTAGYTFKGKAFGMSKIKSVYFGVTGRNLYLWTKDKSWSIDPESNLSGSSRGRGLQYFNHPTTKSIIFRTTITF